MAYPEIIRQVEREKWAREYREITVAHACLDNPEDIKGVLKKELAQRNFESEVEAEKFMGDLTNGVVKWITRWSRK